ncbi:MAG: beta-lactamase family protein, partial [Acidobacteria bacterium]|nr:beta-lactamase family protein [Acidobacteriota bacterium]
MDTDKKKSLGPYGEYSLGLLRSGLFYICLYLCASVVQIAGQGLPVAPPQSVGMSAEKLALIDGLVNEEIANKKLPGAVVIVGHKGKIVFRKAFGNRSLVPNVEPMTVDTIFDVASLTKVVATTTSIMILIERGQLRLSDTIGKFIPEIKDENAKRVTIQQLMVHLSGYAPDFDLKEKWTGHDGMLQALYKEKLRNPSGTKFVYSDIDYIVLGEMVERIGGKTLDVFVKENIFVPLGGLTTTFFRRDLNRDTPNTLYGNLALLPRIAPTEDVCGQQSYLGGVPDKDCGKILQVLHGDVHDPTAYRMNGVAGHAGLFSTADDLARFCQMLLNGGVVPEGGNPSSSEGVSSRGKNTLPTGRVSASSPRRVLSAMSIARMTAPYVVSETGDTRGLGWDMNTSYSSNRGDLFPFGSFGHTGFTGTSIWIDRVSQTFVVFLSNRVHPDGKGDVGPLRAKVATVVASAVEDTPVEAYRLAESVYQSQVAAQIPRFV